jgi:hypothetical protein
MIFGADRARGQPVGGGPKVVGGGTAVDGGAVSGGTAVVTAEDGGVDVVSLPAGDDEGAVVVGSEVDDRGGVVLADVVARGGAGDSIDVPVPAVAVPGLGGRTLR